MAAALTRPELDRSIHERPLIAHIGNPGERALCGTPLRPDSPLAPPHVERCIVCESLARSEAE